MLPDRRLNYFHNRLLDKFGTTDNVIDSVDVIVESDDNAESDNYIESDDNEEFVGY